MRRVHITLLGLALAAALAAAAPAWAESPQTLDAKRAEAIAAFDAGQYEAALPLLREVLHRAPGDPTALNYLAIYRAVVREPACRAAAEAYYAGDTPGVVAAWSGILALDPGDTAVRVLMNRVAGRRNMEVAEALMARARALMDEGRLEEALAEVRKLLGVSPENEAALGLLAMLNTRISRRGLDGLYAQADAARAEGRQADALGLYREILKAEPAERRALRMATEIQREMLAGRYKEARALYHAGSYAEARDAYAAIIAENPEDASARFSLGRLEAIARAVPSATASARPGRAWDVARQGLPAFIQHDTATSGERGAIFALWYASALVPEDAELASLRSAVEAAAPSAARALEPPGEGMDLVSQYLFAALNHIYEGRYDRAVEECTLVLGVEPENVLALKRLGSAHYLLGNADRARAAWKRALALDPGDPEIEEFLQGGG
jgi:tetratricopeptide (TPR) repeat protein